MFRQASELIDSYYAQSCRDRLRHYPALQGNVQCDALVVGAGFSGLHAALRLAAPLEAIGKAWYRLRDSF